MQDQTSFFMAPALFIGDDVFRGRPGGVVSTLHEGVERFLGCRGEEITC